MGLLQRIHSCFLAEEKSPTPESLPAASTPEPKQPQPSVPQAILTDEELRFILDLYN